MVKILFICQGNICRSPMAMFLLRDKLSKLTLKEEVCVTSAALESSTKGEDMHPKAKEQLDMHSICYTKHSAHPLSIKEYLEMDYVLYMESYQKITMKRMMSNNHMEKAHRLFDYTGIKKDIADPYYTGDFSLAYQDIEKGIDAFIEKELKGKVI